jgi:hypothetical protein
MVYLVRQFTKGFSYIQIRIKNQLLTKYSKVEVLLTYWDKLFCKILTKTLKLKDTKANQLMIKIAKVPLAVKYDLLKNYVLKCRELHSVAFL